MKTEKLEEAFMRFGTPLYLYDLDALAADTKRIKEKTAGAARLCYSMKANAFLTEAMAGMTDRVEVCSYGEYLTCRKRNIPPEQIVFSGVLKKPGEFMEMLAQYGSRSLFTIESMNQYAVLTAWCERRKMKVRVLLRLTGGNQFGMDEETIESILRMRDVNPYVRIEGLHYFTGTQKRSLKQNFKELLYLDDFFARMQEKTGFAFSELEYGTGLQVPYFTDMEETDIPEAVGEILQKAKAMKWQGTLTLEMGRAFAARCGFYLTEAFDLKESGGRKYCLVDGGSHQLHYDGQIRGMYEPYITLLPERMNGEEAEWTVCGSLCTGNDVLVQKTVLRGLKEHDVLVFGRAGAYCASEGMALFLSHELPAVVTYRKREGFVLQRSMQQTYSLNMNGGENGKDSGYSE